MQSQHRLTNSFNGTADAISECLKQQNLSEDQFIHLNNQSHLLLNYLTTRHYLETFGIITSNDTQYLNGTIVHRHSDQVQEWFKQLADNPNCAEVINQEVLKNKGTVTLPSIQQIKEVYFPAIVYLLTGCEQELARYCNISQRAGLNAYSSEILKENLMLLTFMSIAHFKFVHLSDFILQKQPRLANYEFNYFGTTALLIVIQAGNPKVVACLLKHGSEINKVSLANAHDLDHKIIPSPLAVAIDKLMQKTSHKSREEDREIIELLLKSGANIHLMSVRGTPLNMCERNLKEADDETRSILELVIHSKNPAFCRLA